VNQFKREYNVIVRVIKFLLYFCLVLTLCAAVIPMALKWHGEQIVFGDNLRGEWVIGYQPTYMWIGEYGPGWPKELPLKWDYGISYRHFYSVIGFMLLGEALAIIFLYKFAKWRTKITRGFPLSLEKE